MSYPVHPNAEPPFPETSPCFVCGREKGHDLPQHVDPSLGTPARCPDSAIPEGKS